MNGCHGGEVVVCEYEKE
ncbi:hypothetical protein A2U01_0106767, partial [Trifolium medium]|nr:hypothetical protein [Trifolium medium]MCI85488.1 hypothetical protein [Trifolium medium]